MDNMNIEKSLEDIELESEVDRLEEMRRVRFKKRTLRNFAIIFFVALIILTFFSNTIMNYSLPEVTTETVYNGSVSQKVRCQGSVEVSLDQDVTVSGKRVVKEVFFEDGDTVKEGDVLMTFEEEENTDLKDAEEELEQLESDYEKQTLRVGPDYSEQLSAINAASDEVTVAETAVEQAKADEASLATARAELDDLQAKYDEKFAEVAPLTEKFNAINELDREQQTPEDQAFIDDYSALSGELDIIKNDLDNKSGEVATLEAKPTVADAEADLATKKATLESLQLSLVSKKKEDGVTAQTNAIDDANAEKKIDKLKDTDDYKELKATGTGIISGLNVKPGDTLDAETQVASIQLADSGYVVTCTIPKKDSQVLKVGNEAEIENLWGDDVSASIRSIKADPSNPNQQSIVKFEVKGNVQVGETLQFAVGNKTGKYDTVIPNGAVKEDSGGKFVYVVKVRATPLGNRYITKKVNVDVLASDTSNSAISGDVSEFDNVIINSSKPLDDGQQVRLTDK